VPLIGNGDRRSVSTPANDHERPAIVEYEKVDEIPFDFNRKPPWW